MGGAVQYTVIQCIVEFLGDRRVLCYTLVYSHVWCRTYSVGQCSKLHCFVLCSTVQCIMVLHSVVLYITLLYCVLCSGAVSYRMVEYIAVPYMTVDRPY